MKGRQSRSMIAMVVWNTAGFSRKPRYSVLKVANIDANYSVPIS